MLMGDLQENPAVLSTAFGIIINFIQYINAEQLKIILMKMEF